MISPAWQLFIDLGVGSALLLCGTILRARVGVLQRLFLPAGVIGGFLGLALGPNGADLLPLSDAFAQYPGILIALVFAALPFAAASTTSGVLTRRLAHLWSFSTVAIVGQWGVGVALAAILLRPLWPDLNPGFGALIAVGFVGGHGTAAAVGEVYAGLGWPEAGPLAMTSATIGVLTAIVGGLVWVAWGSRSGQSRHVGGFDQLPVALRTGLVPVNERVPIGVESVSSNSIDTLALHGGLIAATALVAYGASQWAAEILPDIRLPVFCLAFVMASILRNLLRQTGTIDYIDRDTMGHLSGAFTDLLVVYGIASIRIPILVAYAGPLALLLVAGIGFCAMLFFVLGPRVFDARGGGYWFERSLFTWGWITGVTAMGIALLRIVDPRNESEALADFGVVYLFLAPVEIGLLTAAPLLLAQGHGLALAAATLVTAAALTAATIWRRASN